MEEKENIIVKWAQEDVETLYSLLNKLYIYIYIYITARQRDLVENSELAQQLMFLNSIFSPHCIVLWPEDGFQWPKHIFSLINRIQRKLCFDVPTHS